MFWHTTAHFQHVKESAKVATSILLHICNGCRLLGGPTGGNHCVYAAKFGERLFVKTGDLHSAAYMATKRYGINISRHEALFAPDESSNGRLQPSAADKTLLRRAGTGLRKHEHKLSIRGLPISSPNQHKGSLRTLSAKVLGKGRGLGAPRNPGEKHNT